MKNDRVVTIGGIRATIVNVRREMDEVVIKIDDNTKLKMTVGSIARVEIDDANDSGKAESDRPFVANMGESSLLEKIENMKCLPATIVGELNQLLGTAFQDLTFVRMNVI